MRATFKFQHLNCLRFKPNRHLGVKFRLYDNVFWHSNLSLEMILNPNIKINLARI